MNFTRNTSKYVFRIMTNLNSHSKNHSMKYILHLTEEELKNIIDESIREYTMQIKKAIDALTEQRDNELLKIDDAMKILKVSRKTINNWIDSKKLKCHWLGGRLYFKMKDITESLNSNF